MTSRRVFGFDLLSDSRSDLYRRIRWRMVRRVLHSLGEGGWNWLAFSQVSATIHALHHIDKRGELMKKLLLTLTLAAGIIQPVQANPGGRVMSFLVGAAVALGGGGMYHHRRVLDLGAQLEHARVSNESAREIMDVAVRRMRQHDAATTPYVHCTSDGTKTDGELVGLRCVPRPGAYLRWLISNGPGGQ